MSASGLMAVFLVTAIGAAQGAPPTSPRLLWLDVDQDGFDDVLRFEPGRIASLFLNDGHGGFGESTEAETWLPEPVQDAVLLDPGKQAFNPALVAVATPNATWVLRLEDAQPEVVATLPGAQVLSSRDYDRDGRPDLILDGAIYRQDAEGRFSRVRLVELSAEGELGEDWDLDLGPKERAAIFGARSEESAYDSSQHSDVPADALNARRRPLDSRRPSNPSHPGGSKDGAPSASGGGDEDVSVSGNVGINVGSPATELHIRRNTGSSDGVTRLMLSNDVAGVLNPAEVVLDNRAAGTEQLAAIGMDAPERDFYIWVNGQDRLNLDQDGNLGLGTASPKHLLDLGSTFGRKLAVYQNAEGSSFSGMGASDGRLDLYSSSPVDTDPAMVVKSTGEVGIGTIDPEARLHVLGDVITDGELTVRNGLIVAPLGVSTEYLGTNLIEHINPGGRGSVYEYAYGDIWELTFPSQPYTRLKVDDAGLLVGGGVVATGDLNAEGITTPLFEALGGGDEDPVLVVKETRNVGIGTLDPQHRLDLGLGLGRKLAVYQNPSGENFYGFGISDNILELHASSGTDEDPAMVITNTGDVGIGTIDPYHRLDLGTGFGHKLAVYQTASGGNAGKHFYGLGMSSATLELHADSDTDDAPGMVLKNDGSVGIGTTDPDARLHVEGDLIATGEILAHRISVDELQLDGISAGALYANEDFVGIGGGTPVDNETFSISSSNSPNGFNGMYVNSIPGQFAQPQVGYGYALDSRSKAAHYLHNDAWYLSLNKTDRLQVSQAGISVWGEYRYTSDGHETTPASHYVNNRGAWQLDVDGTSMLEVSSAGLKVNKEIRVTSDGWSDFVFEDDYPLLPLSALKGCITSDGHLPDIPSAAEIQDHGIPLGEMQARLLQKIEELTLYVIQNEERLEALETDADRLREENQTLRTERSSNVH